MVTQQQNPVGWHGAGFLYRPENLFATPISQALGLAYQIIWINRRGGIKELRIISWVCIHALLIHGCSLINDVNPNIAETSVNQRRAATGIHPHRSRRGRPRHTSKWEAKYKFPAADTRNLATGGTAKVIRSKTATWGFLGAVGQLRSLRNEQSC
ncbi:hypothetical protein P154DRAFT_193403 [Amniculicola lignicola CBS 123094]|uniref:Uncharacterized protein n=1 Tax=Amniculicola lignicola CBS 123094 TaxID=1392246 RepID=A0A6A5WKN3_9PLEO|nr:hypothetical protein P154DRAFT_193403 [Amniculicola lignicola CBS 123094]